MKTKIIKLLSKPKLFIPVATVITVIAVVLLYPRIGNAPRITDTSLFPETISNAPALSGDTLDLAFPKSGRIESINVKNGDIVQKGDVIAKLSAPEAEGAVSQAKGALALAEAQFASLNLDYANTKKQQDILVNNAYQTLLKTPPEAVAKDSGTDHLTTKYPLPTISGNYLLNKEGVITIKTYMAAQGMSFTATGLIDDSNMITSNPIPLGSSGLSILFPSNITTDLTWTITLPNTHSTAYAANKNAYELALSNRDKVLSELAQNIGVSNDTSVAKAQVDAARGAYNAALGLYQSNLIVAPVTGTVNFINENLKQGESVTAGKTVVSITVK